MGAASKPPPCHDVHNGEMPLSGKILALSDIAQRVRIPAFPDMRRVRISPSGVTCEGLKEFVWVRHKSHKDLAPLQSR